MPRPMTKYKPIQEPKKPLHSFTDIRGGNKAYCKYGKLSTYTNIAQAEKKVAELRILGYDCFRSFKWPFLIILNTES
jgi:hypothetical protein